VHEAPYEIKPASVLEKIHQAYGPGLGDPANIARPSVVSCP